MELHLVSGADIRAGKLEGLDLLVMPGGSSKVQYDQLGAEGVAKMKDFLRAGGGYIGTCAGCCLLADEPVKRANVIPWKITGSEGDLFFPRIELTPAGQKSLGLEKGPHQIRYFAGPFMWPTTNRIEGADFELWGVYKSEVCLKGRINEAKRMYGSAAVIGGTYGKGKVFVTALHPEYFDSTLYMIKAAFKYVTGRDVTFPARVRTPRALTVGFYAGRTEKAPLETALALAREKDFDLMPIDKTGAMRRDLDHVDVLVIASDEIKKKNNAAFAEAVARFEARGGKSVYCCRGAEVAPTGAVVSEPGAAAVDAVRKLFR